MSSDYRHRQLNRLTYKIIGCVYEVHSCLGPGLLESAYESSLFYELDTSGLGVQRQVTIPMTYKQIRVEAGYRADLVVEGAVLLEVKSVE